MTEASETSVESARVFAEKHDLTESVKQDLAQLLESTWRDGVRAERGFAFMERILNQVQAETSTTE